MALAIVDNDQSTFVERAQDLDVMGEDVQPQAQQLLWRMARTVCAPLTMPWYRCGVDDDQLLVDLKKMGPEIVRYPELRSPPELVYLHRSLGGIYAMLRRLEHEFDYSDLFRAHANYVLDVAEGRKDDGEPVGWTVNVS